MERNGNDDQRVVEQHYFIGDNDLPLCQLATGERNEDAEEFHGTLCVACIRYARRAELKTIEVSKRV